MEFRQLAPYLRGIIIILSRAEQRRYGMGKMAQARTSIFQGIKPVELRQNEACGFYLYMDLHVKLCVSPLGSQLMRMLYLRHFEHFRIRERKTE